MTERARRPHVAPALNVGEKAAEAARQELGLGLESPLSNVLAVVEDLGEVPVTVAEFGNDVAGLYVRRRKLPFIFVNGIHQPVRQRFTLAHEFGHHRMNHRPRVDSVQNVHGTPRDPDEVQANYFAGAFLAPAPAVRNWVERHSEMTVDMEFVVTLASFFGISVMAAIIRLDRGGIISASTAERLKSGVQRKEHHGMPAALGLPTFSDELSRLRDQARLPRLPARMTRSALRANDAGLVTDDELSELLRGGVPNDGDEDDGLPF